MSAKKTIHCFPLFPIYIIVWKQNPKNKAKRPHSLQIELRRKTVITGVEEVISVSETSATMLTSSGGLRIEGGGLHLNKYNSEEGTLVLDGDVNRLTYSDASATGKGFLKKVFK